MAQPLKFLCDDWLSLIEEAKKVKHEQFGQYADECEKFYDTAHNWMWKTEYARGPQGFIESAGEVPFPTFQMTVNRVFEAVALFGPAMMQRYPQCSVTPADPPMIPPEALGFAQEMPEYEQLIVEQQQAKAVRALTASLQEHYLSWLQVEGNKKRHARRSITEALVGGAGYVLTDLCSQPGSQIAYPRSRHLSWRQVIKDPDALHDEDVQWIGIEWCQPVNLVERRFNLAPGSLKGRMQSVASQSSRRGRKEAASKQEGKSFDMIRYTEIFSKNGIGDRLKNSKGDRDLSGFGQYVYLVVSKGVPFPLNLPDELLAGDDPQPAIEAAQWPIPFWLDDSAGSGWPITELSYYDKSQCVWPVSLFKPAIGWMRFVNWCMSFLADKVASTSHEYLGMMKAASKEIKEQLLTQRGPIKLIEIAELMGQNINQVIGFLQKPAFDYTIFQMVEKALEFIDKTTGLTELVYGLSSAQMRSATEAGIRNDRVSVRPDDMTEKTEDWYSATMLREMIAAAYTLEAEDVEPVLGPLGARIFQREVLEQNPEILVRDYRYRVAAGSTRKPNKAMLLQGLNDFGQVAGPVMQQLALAGIVDPWNAYAADVANALDLPDPDRYLAQLPQPQEQGPSPEEQEREQEIRHEEDRHEQRMQHDSEKMNLALFGQRRKIALAEEAGRAKVKAAKANGSKSA